MKRHLIPLLIALILIFPVGAIAAPREYLFQDERICDAEQVFCLRGTLSYDANPRLLRLSARVKTAPGPGLLRISLSGVNELGHRRFAQFEVRVRGHNSEIIDHKMIPDYPDVQGWVIDRVEFIAGKTATFRV